jgi:hypothetical protein
MTQEGTVPVYTVEFRSDVYLEGLFEIDAGRNVDKLAGVRVNQVNRLCHLFSIKMLNQTIPEQ